MKPGMARFSVGALAANHGDTNLGAVALTTRVPITKATHITALAGVFTRTNAGINLRDFQIGLPVLALDKASFRIEVRPGVSVPLGLATSGLNYTILATGSLDPMIGGTLAYGESWVFVGDIDSRMSLYACPDDVVDGMYSQGTGRLAKRIGTGAAFVGLTLGGQAKDDRDAGFMELAPIIGGQIPLSRDWGAGLNLRTPVWTTNDHLPYNVAASLSLSWIARPR